MNEILFFLHVIVVLGFVLAALRLGKEALIVCTALQAVLANFFVLKQTNLFGFTVTCSDVFAVGCIASLNLIQEYFNKETARKAIWISSFALLFYVLMTQFHLLYLPSVADTTQASFAALLKITPRLLLASLTTFFLVQQFDIYLFTFLKKRFAKNSFAMRSGISLMTTQLIDTILFTLLGLYGLGFSIIDIIIISFLLKALIISLSLPINMIARRLHCEI